MHYFCCDSKKFEKKNEYHKSQQKQHVAYKQRHNCFQFFGCLKTTQVSKRDVFLLAKVQYISFSIEAESKN